MNCLNLSKRLHLGYELRVLQLRKKRRRLITGFIGHLCYMVLLITTFLLQHGRTVGDRFTLVETLKTAVRDLETADGVLFDGISTIPQFWDWTENAFLTQLGAQEGDRVFIRTYNQIVGSVRMVNTRVTSDSCAYKHSKWSTRVLEARRPLLHAAEALYPECYGPTGYGLATQPFGPWHDPEKWAAAAGDASYIVDLGKDPTFAALKLAEMRRENFISKHTRRATISLTVYNNALPMFCFLRLVFDVSPTGQLRTYFVVEAMNVQEYMAPTFWLQATFELVLLLVTISHIVGEYQELREYMRELGGTRPGIRAYLNDPWNFLDTIQSVALICIYVQWLWLVFDGSRDIDLDTKQYVDLESTARIFRTYNVLFNVIILLALFNVLQYTGLDDRMALLTRSVYESLGNLVPFGLIFMIFVVIFATIGHLLYGPLLPEWAGMGNSIVTAIDIMMGNYQFGGLQEGLDPEDLLNYFVAVIFFYVYFFLMMLIVLNIVIAILMDGYASVQETAQSAVEEHIKYNVGPLLPSMIQSWKRSWRQLTARSHIVEERVPWTEDRWMRDLQIVMARRKSKGQNSTVILVGSLASDLKDLPTSAGEDVHWQIRITFQERPFIAPSDINQPFNEPSMDNEVRSVNQAVHEQDTRLRALFMLTSDIHKSFFAKETVKAHDDSSGGRSGPSTTSASHSDRESHLLQLVHSQQQTIAQQAAALKEQASRIRAFEVRNGDASVDDAAPVSDDGDAPAGTLARHVGSIVGPVTSDAPLVESASEANAVESAREGQNVDKQGQQEKKT